MIVANDIIKEMGLTMLYGVGGLAVITGLALLYWWWRNRK